MKQVSFQFYRAIAAWLLTCSIVAAATTVTLRERVVLKSSVVRLGDVAEIVTADREQGRALAARLLMPAPAPGTQRFLRQREIQDLLAAHGDDLAQLEFAGAGQVSIVSPDAIQASPAVVSDRGIDRQAVLVVGHGTRAATEPIGSDASDQLEDHVANELRDQFRQAIINHLTAQAGRSEAWRVSCDIAQRHLAQLQTATSAPKCSGGTAPWTGRQRFVVSFSTAGGPVQTPIYADVALATQVVVATRPVERGATITAAHVELQTIDYTSQVTDRRATVESVESILGMEARQALQTGDIVFTDLVQSPLLVKRGDVIAVVSQGGGIRVRTSAIARQDGARGDLVQVETLEAKVRYDVRVTGTREAAVFAAAAPSVARRELPADAAWRR